MTTWLLIYLSLMVVFLALAVVHRAMAEKCNRVALLIELIVLYVTVLFMVVIQSRDLKLVKPPEMPRGARSGVHEGDLGFGWRWVASRATAPHLKASGWSNNGIFCLSHLGAKRVVPA